MRVCGVREFQSISNYNMFKINSALILYEPPVLPKCRDEDKFGRVLKGEGAILRVGMCLRGSFHLNKELVCYLQL